MWNFEEHWHGEALAGVLAAHGEAAGTARIAPLRRRRRLAEWQSPLTQAAASAVTGRAFVAVHMTWGAVNEWTTQAGYARLIARTQHPVLTDMLRRIMRQEARHIDFYAGQARARLAASSRARWLARNALRRFWGPVGSGVMPDDEVRFICRYLFGDDEGRQAALRIDRRIDRLPGLDGLRLLHHAGRRLVGGVYLAA
jgi:hypothetical protein